MAGIVWDEQGSKRYETGVDHGVLYVKDTEDWIEGIGDQTTPGSETGIKTVYTNGVPWNGITSVSKSPSGAEANDIYADNIKYASIRSTETFGATIEAYTYPDEFAECDGSAVIGGGLFLGQQQRKMFGFSFRTDIGDDNDTGINKNEKYKLHLIYNATASPSESSYNTINDSPEAITFSWELTTIPASAGNVYLPTACITIDSTKLTTKGLLALKALEAILYGYVSGGTDKKGSLPMPEDVLKLFETTGTGNSEKLKNYTISDGNNGTVSIAVGGET